ncbi:putative glucan endo-1,3-beta-glucosidase eglC [Tolypocladium ophioglossoides CBS 100239]|uniref:Probable glucan endo-1,3-beta-glucosidase eglC n=1 Tax=Tolypocladium ophioglossoides (strain CBS 100239) TaxID=1163406 RepID=A0A0L0N272_TOLOC|nr:putative glucan endo-1,3-beta-glucosidase eglC [Tolypocladium ophioglossoides CBS 100239]
MPSSAYLLTLAAAVSSASAAFQGFNYGSTFTNGQAKVQSDFEAEFKTAAGLDGTNGGFRSARLYTMVQGGSANDPISAIPAAISTKTSLLFGLWASAGDASFKNEITALQKTIDQYCSQLDGLVAGISVGSEDLYRISPIGQAASPDPGAAPDTLVGYIKQVRDTIKGTCLKDAPIGHVDTWTVYVNQTNKPVIDAVDWVGMDAYPYYENTKPNGLDQAKSLFQAALANTQGASGGKPVWITETGWPVSGKISGAAVPSTQNAEVFWKDVGCPLFGQTNVWWFTLQDGAPTTPNPSFGVIGSQLTTTPVYDLSCNKAVASSSATSSASSSGAPAKIVVPSAGTSSGSQPASTTGSGSSSGSGSGSGSGSASNSAPAASGTALSSAAVPPPVGGSNYTSAGGYPSYSTGAQPTKTGGSSTQPGVTNISKGSAGQLNSFGAAAVALVMAAAVL